MAPTYAAPGFRLCDNFSEGRFSFSYSAEKYGYRTFDTTTFATRTFATGTTATTAHLLLRYFATTI